MNDNPEKCCVLKNFSSVQSLSCVRKYSQPKVESYVLFSKNFLGLKLRRQPLKQP